MKLVQKKIVLNQSGTVRITPEEVEDLWLLYNLMAPGDVVIAETTRKVLAESGKGKNPARVRLVLEIKITDVTYEKDSEIIRVKGRTIAGNPHVSVGSFHTIEIEKNKEFDLRKTIWDSVSVDSLRESCKKTSYADLAVILMQERMASLYLVGKKITLCENIDEEDLPSNYKKNANMFFESIFRAFVKHIDFGVVRCVVVGSQGSIKDEFRSYLLLQAKKLKMKAIEENKSRIVLVGSSNKTMSLEYVLCDNTVMNLIKDTKAAMEIRVFKEFTEMLSNNPDRACYGPKDVEIANEFKAIESLLITDDLLKSAEDETRHKYTELMKSVKNVGGNTFVYSTKHVFGEQLATLTGIAAVLRFPLPDIDEMVL